MTYMFLINYLFSSSVTFRRDYFIQFNRIAILALQYSITLHIKSYLMCSGNISLHGYFHLSNITQNFQIFIFFFNERWDFNFVIHEFSPIKVLISNSYFYKFIIYNLSKIYINSDDMGIYFLFGIFVSCFIILGSSFYGEYKLIIILGWIIAFLLSCCFIILGSSLYGKDKLIWILVLIIVCTLFFYIIGAYLWSITIPPLILIFGRIIVFLLGILFFLYYRCFAVFQRFFLLITHFREWINISYLCLRSCLVFGSLVARKQPNQLFFSASASLWVKKASQPMSHSTSLVIWGSNLRSTGWARNYSSAPPTERLSVCNLKLNPLWVTGFVDGEGSFHVSVRKNKDSNHGWRVEQRFTLVLHKKDEPLLQKIKSYLVPSPPWGGGGGDQRGPTGDPPRVLVESVYRDHKQSQLQVTSDHLKEDLAKIIYHFNKFPLLTKKRVRLSS